MTITDGNVGFHRESSSPVNKHSLSGTPNHGTMGFSNEAFILSDIGVKEPPSFLREGWMDPQGWKCIDNENDEHPDLPKDIEDSVAWFSKEASLVKDDTLIAEVDTISGICEKEENFPRTISSEPIIGRDSMKLPPSRISSTGPVTYRSTEDCKAAASCPKIGRCSTRATMERSSALVSRNAGALVSDGSSLLFDAVSSVIREAFLGCFRCFPCSEGQLTCLEEVDTEPKGAWFDCKRVQSKDNFCYSNPTINLAEEVTSEPKFNRRQKLPTDEQADDVTAVRTLAASIHETQSDESRTHSVNQTSHTETEGNDSGESHDVFLAKDNPKISFTLQLEEDYKQRAADLGRSEGRRHDSDSGSSAKSPEFMDSSNQNNSFSWRSFDWRETEEEFPVLHESNLELADFNISFGEEFESDDIHGDVWEDTELKEAFGIYNLNAFYSYGSNSPIVLSSTSCKPLNEKFDEVFPTKQAVTNPNIENDFELASNNRVYNVKSPTKENEISLSQRKWISQEALYNIVRQFLTLEGRDSFSRNFRLYKDNLNCDNYFIYNGRRITKLLLFDLVNEKLLCYRERYFFSNPLQINFIPTEKIESQVFQVLNNISVKPFQSKKCRKIYDAVKYENDAMVSTVVAENLKREERSWTDYAKEEEERKQLVSNEILNELLTDTVSLFNTIVKKKFPIEACQL